MEEYGDTAESLRKQLGQARKLGKHVESEQTRRKPEINAKEHSRTTQEKTRESLGHVMQGHTLETLVIVKE
jgi:hypothetical protein